MVDGTLMIPGALSLHGHYNELSMPVVIMAREGDKVVFARRAKQLQACIPGSVLQIVKSAEHMIHHSAPQQVVEVIRQVVEASSDVSDTQTSLLRAVAKRWVAAA